MTLAYATYTMDATLSDLISSYDPTKSVDTVTVLASQTLVRGQVVGKLTTSTATASAVTGTGNGTCATVTAGAKAKPGIYNIRCITAATQADTTTLAGAASAKNVGNGTISTAVMTSAVIGVYTVEVGPISGAPATAGFLVRDPNGSYVGQGAVGTQFVGGGLTFTLSDGATDFQEGDLFTYTVPALTTGSAPGGVWQVTDPEGGSMPDAVVGTAYTNEQINFTLTDGSTNFAAAAAFTVTVSGSGKVVEWDQDAVTGAQVAAGVMIENCTATGDTLATMIARDAVLLSGQLTWKAAATDAEKAQALKELNALSIVVRTEIS